MVRELERISNNWEFPSTAPAANPVFFRTYSRRQETGRETWKEVCDRTLQGLTQLGELTPQEAQIIERMQSQLKTTVGARFLWIGGTKWFEKPENFSGGFNCTSRDITDWESFGIMMELAMMGCGTGAVLEPKYINQLPPIRNHLTINMPGEIGLTIPELRRQTTEVKIDNHHVYIYVGDSREGWVKSYQTLLELSSDERFAGEINVSIDLSDVRPAGEVLQGFGGVANPIKLSELYQRCVAVLNQAVGRKLNSVECCLLIDEAAACVVAGNIRRSAGMRQGDSNDPLFTNAKANLWQQDESGKWRIDPQRDALRMSNHTRVFHHKPTFDECLEAVRQQYYSGEGAIQWAGEAVARANRDLLKTPELKTDFLRAYEQDQAEQWLRQLNPQLSDHEIEHRLARYALNPCITEDTWIHTEYGARQVKELIGIQHSVYVNGELFSTTAKGFFFTGVKPVVQLHTKPGYTLRLTENHQVLKVTAQTQKQQCSEWCEVQDLKPGDRILIHNHRALQPWDGNGTFAEGWLLGNFWSHTKQLSGFRKKNRIIALDTQHITSTVSWEKVASKFGLEPGFQEITPEVEKASYEFYRGFLKSLFDANGNINITESKEIIIQLAQSNLSNLAAIQRMLLRLGIAATIYQNYQHEEISKLSDRQPNLAQTNHNLVISNDNIIVFQQLIGFQESTKSQQLALALASEEGELTRERFTVEISAIIPAGEAPVYDCTVPSGSRFDANGFVAHNCGEIIGTDFHCNLSQVHLDLLDPNDWKEQEDAFTAAALSVAALLKRGFLESRFQKSREIDPIVGVSFGGLFDFFVKAFGVEWLRWWVEGRPETTLGLEFKRREQEYLSHWQNIAHQVVWDYCDRHHLNKPNRCTTVQPSGTKVLLTGGSPGWHPPKSQRFLRRITFAKNDPVALACIDYGYNVVPSQDDKDENGNLLNDPFDPRCSAWLVEIPTEVCWTNLPGADEIEIEKFSALAQFDFYMQVQRYYTTHNTSATIELTEAEIDVVGQRIYQTIQNDEGYISAALFARFNAPFPRLPFEKIDQDTYKRLQKEVKARQKINDFYTALRRYDLGYSMVEGPAGCDSDKCMMPDYKG